MTAGGDIIGRYSNVHDNRLQLYRQQQHRPLPVDVLRAPSPTPARSQSPPQPAPVFMLAVRSRVDSRGRLFTGARQFQDHAEHLEL